MSDAGQKCYELNRKDGFWFYVIKFFFLEAWKILKKKNDRKKWTTLLCPSSKVDYSSMSIIKRGLPFSFNHQKWTILLFPSLKLDYLSMPIIKSGLHFYVHHQMWTTLLCPSSKLNKIIKKWTTLLFPSSKVDHFSMSIMKQPLCVHALLRWIVSLIDSRQPV